MLLEFLGAVFADQLQREGRVGAGLGGFGAGVKRGALGSWRRRWSGRRRRSRRRWFRSSSVGVAGGPDSGAEKGVSEVVVS